MKYRPQICVTAYGSEESIIGSAMTSVEGFGDNKIDIYRSDERMEGPRHIAGPNV